MGSVSTTATGDWTVFFGCTVDGEDVTSTNGEAWSDIDLMDALPSGATITDITVSATVQLDATRSNPTIPCAPWIQFADKAEYLAGTYHPAVWLFGAQQGLPDDDAVHVVTYSLVDGLADAEALATFAAGMLASPAPWVVFVKGPQAATTGSSITYFAPITVTVFYDDGTTFAPPLRLYPRSDGLGASSAKRLYPPSRSIQASNRLTGYL